MSLSEKEVEKKSPDLCIAEGCQEKSIFECRFCWEHLPKEERKEYILKIEKDAKAGKDLSDANFRLVDFSGAKFFSMLIFLEPNSQGQIYPRPTSLAPILLVPTFLILT